MASMSTPINQLPNNIPNEVIKQNSHQLEDPSITDVINEMEREFSSHNEAPQQIPPQRQRIPQMQQQPPPHMQQPPPHMQQPPPQYYQQPPPNMNVQHIFQQQYPVNNYQQHNKFNPNQFNNSNNGNNGNNNDYLNTYISKENAQRAILAAFIAAIVFYPFELGFIYDRIPFLTNMNQYDRMLRTLFLAVTFYVILLKVNI
jgi:hypothetical protein